MIIEIVFYPIRINDNVLLDAYNSLFYAASFRAPCTTYLCSIKSPDNVQYWFMDSHHYDAELFEFNESVKYATHLKQYDHFTYDDVLHKKNDIVDSLTRQPYTFR